MAKSQAEQAFTHSGSRKWCLCIQKDPGCAHPVNRHSLTHWVPRLLEGCPLLPPSLNHPSFAASAMLVVGRGLKIKREKEMAFLDFQGCSRNSSLYWQQEVGQEGFTLAPNSPGAAYL